MFYCALDCTGPASTRAQPHPPSVLALVTPAGDYDLILRSLVPKADVQIVGDLMYGLLPIDSKASKTFKLINQGTAAASFKLDWDK